MHNINITVNGQIGAGKTTFVRTLVPLAPRVVIFDPLDDYDGGSLKVPVTILESFRDAAGYYVQHRRDPTMRLVFRGPSTTSFADQERELEPFRYMLRLLAHSQRVDRLPPLALVLEESTFYADRNNPWPEIRAIYLYGRRWRINTISIAQTDVDISTQVRRNSQIVVALRNVKPSTDAARYFGGDVEKLGRLEKLTPGTKPVAGTHYLTYPPDIDVAGEWKAANTPGSLPPEAVGAAVATASPAAKPAAASAPRRKA